MSPRKKPFRDEIEKETLIRASAYFPVVQRYARYKWNLDYRFFFIIRWCRWKQHCNGSFILKDFETNEFNYAWRPHRMRWLIEEGWIVKSHKSTGKKGDRDRYRLTQLGLNRLAELDRMLMGYTPIPVSRYSPLKNGYYRRTADQCNEDEDFQQIPRATHIKTTT